MKKLLSDLYINFLISSFSKIEMTKLSKVLGKGFSHDRFTKMLLDDNFQSDQELFKAIKPMMREYEDEIAGAIIIDDTILHKPYTKESDIVCWHYDHTTGRAVKGIEMLNFLYTNVVGEDISIPVGYELTSKRLEYSSIEDKKRHRRSEFTKNEIMQEKLCIIEKCLKVKYKYILADSWFSSVGNMNYIERELGKKFVFAVKSNRNVALSYEDKIKGRYCKISELDMRSCSSCLVYIKGYEQPLRYVRLVSKDGNDGKAVYSYLITNDIEISPSSVSAIYQRWWRVEQYHQSLKQNLKIEQSPTRSQVSQNNHIYFTVVGFVKLEKLKLNFKMNHYSIKEQIYIRALHSAFEELRQLDVA
jgi:hypothetical protein